MPLPPANGATPVMPRDSNLWMWSHALQMLEQAEALRRRFCLPQPRSAVQPAWEPPIDVIETARHLIVTLALPGIRPESLEVVSRDDMLIVSAVRPLPSDIETTTIHRLEIPYGRFERHLPLPPQYRLGEEPRYENGCLILRFSRSPTPL